MARTKQPSHQDVATATAAINVSEDSESDDAIVMEVEQPKATQQPKAKKPPVAIASTKSTATKLPVKAPNGALKSSKVKGKAKADPQDGEGDVEMDVDGKKWTDYAIHGSKTMDSASLHKENELLIEQNERLQVALDELMEAVRPSAREEALQAEIDSLNDLLKSQQSLLELRNSEYTKSRLINRNPAEPADWVTLDWADAQRDKAMVELTVQMDKLVARAEKAEKARKDADREGAEARRQLATVQRELDAEVEHSKKLQAEIGRRPTMSAPVSTSGFGGSSSSQAKKGGPGAFELERKLELFEDLTSVSIISYVESLVQPGNVKKVTYTCLLSVENKEFPFKLAIWDARVAPKGEETEHVVYSPGEPLDPELELGYLTSTFTFPRSQMRVFYHNMLNVLTDSGQEEEEEEVEEE